MGGYPAAKAAFEAAERSDVDPDWDRALSCLVLGDNIGPAVFVIATLQSAGVEFIAENGGGAGVRLRKG